MEITKRRVAIGAGVVAGAAVAAAGVRFGFGIRTAISQGGSPWGGTINWFLARKSVIGFGVKNAVDGNPLQIGSRLGNSMNAKRAEETVRTMENVIFYDGARQVGKKLHIGYDNGPDAFRHTGASALINYRLRGGDSPISKDVLAYMRDVSVGRQQVGRGAAELGDIAAPRGRTISAQASDELFDGVQLAHERDSRLARFDQLHMENSGAQDIHNNALGRTIGIEAAAQHATMGADELARTAQDELRGLPSGITDALRALDPGEQVVMARVVRSIEDGRAVTMSELPDVVYRSAEHPDGLLGLHQVPHPARPEDIYDIAADGARSVRKMAPPAQGYPQPFVDGKYVPGMARVKADLGMVLAT
jgi:hypothetical protein